MTNRTDNFTRADTSSAIGTPSDGGSAWSQLSGTWGIDTNQGYCSTISSQAICVLESSVSNVTVQVTYNADVDNGGLVSRCADNNNYILARVNGASNTLTLFKNVAGTFTQLTTVTATVAAGDVIKLVSDSSNLHEVFVNGVSQTSATDAAGSTNTKHGLRAHNVNSARYDDFSITAIATGGGTTSGTSAATSGATGTLTGTGALSGTSAATSGATGTLANGAAGSLTGTSAATSGATATLTAIGALIGSSQIVSGATGTLIDAIGHLSGTIAASSGATGTLRNGTPRTSITGTAQLAPPLVQIWADFDEDARL